MTEEQWLTCRDWDTWEEMWRHVPSHPRRKLGLFGVACCRGCWHLLRDERSRRAVEVAERYADGRASRDEFWLAFMEACDASEATDIPEEALDTASEEDHEIASAQVAVRYLTEATAKDFVCWHEVGMFAPLPAPDGRRHKHPSPLEMAGACDLLREVYGNPFRPARLDPIWRTPSVFTLARSAYEARTLPAGTLDPLHLRILADALEEAGCADLAILDHFRGPGPHVRGCWALDLILGKG